MLRCMNCGKEFTEGDVIFRIKTGVAYCMECANKKFTREEQREMCDGDEDATFWTNYEPECDDEEN